MSTHAGGQPGGHEPLTPPKGSHLVRRTAAELMHQQASEQHVEAELERRWRQMQLAADKSFTEAMARAVADYDAELRLAAAAWEEAVQLAQRECDRITAAAYEALRRQLAAAEAARQAIVGPADQLYTAGVDRAQHRFASELRHAEHAYRAAATDIEKVQATARSMHAVAQNKTSLPPAAWSRSCWAACRCRLICCARDQPTSHSSRVCVPACEHGRQPLTWAASDR